MKLVGSSLKTRELFISERNVKSPRRYKRAVARTSGISSLITSESGDGIRILENAGNVNIDQNYI